MQEKILKAKPGMPMLLLFIVLYLAAIGLIVFGGTLISNEIDVFGGIFLAIGIIWVMVGFIPFFGLKVIKPQEALVLTLFGKYIGTLKEAGFFFVHPFALAVNPAARTKLGQSGDVESALVSVFLLQERTRQFRCQQKISLKIMTLNNSKQKSMMH